MLSRALTEGVHWVGAIDWDRRTFDELIPLPEGTSYNAYLVRGTAKTALVDTVDPAFGALLLERLQTLGVTRLDYVISNHAEQDHSGSIPIVLERFPEAQVLASPKARNILMDLLGVPEERIQPVEDGATLPLGGRTFRFIHFPWVHWPETMLTWLEEDRMLFSCDLFGAHLAASDLAAPAGGAGLEAAKRYYAEIMMPYRNTIAGNLPRVMELPVGTICPSHGPVLHQPRRMLEAYAEWVGGAPRNRAVIAYTSMHASTRHMVEHLAEALIARSVGVDLFNLATADLGRLAVALVDAATIVLGSPTVMGGAHPLVANAAYVANLLKPKARFATIVGSYGWGGKMVSLLTSMLPNLKVELLEPVVAKGFPKAEDLAALDRLADQIAERHAGLEAEGSRGC
jgi:flavorubredoxin